MLGSAVSRAWPWPAVAVLATALVGGCKSSPFDPGITWSDVGRSAGESITSPLVWAPAAGALVFQIDDWDHRVSDWAVKRTPIFGSPDSAEDTSDTLKNVAIGLGIAVPLFAPEPGGRDELLARKAWRGGLDAAALGVTSVVTTGLKDAVGRERPDEASDRSFPSAHASSSAVSTANALGALDLYELPPVADVAGRVALIGLPYATGWARVEAERHYPADVLTGIAIGNFFGLWANGLLDPENEDGIEVVFTPAEDGVRLGILLPADHELEERERCIARLRAIYARPEVRAMLAEHSGDAISDRAQALGPES
jgi:membrane-associated phospholipid phosphatase